MDPDCNQTPPHLYTSAGMQELTKAITAEFAKMPEGTPVTAAAFLHLADRENVSRTLCALAKCGEVFRVSRGVYVATVISRFGRHGPGVHLFIEQLANQSGEAIAPFGATCANGLGLTTQVPMHMVFWTSGRTRSYKMGKLVIYLQHVPDWQLVHLSSGMSPRESCYGRWCGLAPPR